MSNFIKNLEKKNRLVGTVLNDTGFEPYSITISDFNIDLQGKYQAGVANKIAELCGSMSVDGSGYVSGSKKMSIDESDSGESGFAINVNFTLT